MTPFYFGRGERRLFGAYEAARKGGAAARAVVLCHSLGAEHVHAYRTMRHLSGKLALAGFHTLRFDYFGTGDSAGEMSEASLEGWGDDIESAVDELRDMTGAARVSLVGLRLGATLAARFAARRPERADALVLWDPLASGEEYLAAMSSLSAANPRARTISAESAANEDGFEIEGFSITSAMAEELRAIDLNALTRSLQARTLVVTTQSGGSSEALRRASPSHLAVEHFASVSPWIEDPDMMGAMPADIVLRIVQWLQ